MVRSVGIRKSALPTGMDAYRTDQITSRKHGKSQPRLLLVFTFYGLYYINYFLIALRYQRALSESTDLFYTTLPL